MSSDPRQRFKDKPEAKQWSELTASTLFAEASEAALVVMVNNFPIMTDVVTASAVAWKLQGARDYLVTLKNLSSSEPVPKPRPTGNLDHSLKERP